MRRRRGRRRGGMSLFKAGVIGIAVVAIFTYLGFTKFANPFASPFTVHAVFPNANGLRPDSLVRIAGVNVGKVTGITALTKDPQGAANVSMTVDDIGLPLHQDASFQIRPRIFLEGNFVVDIHPGTPSSPTVSSGYTFPIQQGSNPVQLDQILTSLQADTRKNLQILLTQAGRGLYDAAPSFNRSIQYWLPAYQYSAIVTHDALGIQPHDLSKYISAQATVSQAFDQHPQNLQSLITDFNRTSAAFAVQQANLQAAVNELPRTLAAATPALNALNSALCGPPLCNFVGPVRSFARALDAAVRGQPTSALTAINSSLPFITQLRLLVQPSELQGLAKDLAVTVPALAKLTKDTIPLMKNQVRPASSCAANVILPWSHLTINEPNFNTRQGIPPRETFQEQLLFLPGLAGESRDFDANGPWIRVLGQGDLTYSLSQGLFGQALAPFQGVQPLPPPGWKAPPLQQKVPCETQPAITDLNTPTGIPPAQMATNLSAPGAKQRFDAATQALDNLMALMIKQQGGNLKVQGATATPSAAPAAPAPASAGKQSQQQVFAPGAKAVGKAK